MTLPIVALALSFACSDVAQPSIAPPQQPVPAPERVDVVASSALMKAHAGKLKVTASTFWPGWPAERLLDGDVKTSWFSAKGDAAAKGKKPWVMIAFPTNVDVTKVRLYGNREPSWPKGFTIHYGVVELLDDKGTVLATQKNEGKNTLADVDFTFKSTVSGVRAVRFTSLMDEGDKTTYEDIALAEIVVE
jgi:hypothetical protein